MNVALTLTPSVRVAGPDDYQEVCRLLMLAQAENAIFKPNPAKVDRYIRRFLWAGDIKDYVWDGFRWVPDDGPRGCFGVIGSPDALEGVCMLALGCFWYTDQIHLEEYLVFVDPSFRKGDARHGLALVNWAKAQVAKTSIPVICGILSNNRTAAKVRLYRRHFSEVGSYFFYDGTGKPNFAADEITGPGTLVRSSSMAA